MSINITRESSSIDRVLENSDQHDPEVACLDPRFNSIPSIVASELVLAIDLMPDTRDQNHRFIFNPLESHADNTASIEAYPSASAPEMEPEGVLVPNGLIRSGIIANQIESQQLNIKQKILLISSYYSLIAFYLFANFINEIPAVKKEEMSKTNQSLLLGCSMALLNAFGALIGNRIRKNFIKNKTYPFSDSIVGCAVSSISAGLIAGTTLAFDKNKKIGDGIFYSFLYNFLMIGPYHGLDICFRNRVRKANLASPNGVLDQASYIEMNRRERAEILNNIRMAQSRSDQNLGVERATQLNSSTTTISRLDSHSRAIDNTT